MSSTAEKDFKKELAALGDKISASRIESLTKKAIKLTLKQSDFVLETIGSYIQKARKEARLGAMYLIDSLAKSCLKLSEKDDNFKNIYFRKLPERLGELIPILFDCEAKEREKIKKIITIWAQQERMFMPGFASHMMKKFEAFGRSNPAQLPTVKQVKPSSSKPIVKQEPMEKPLQESIMAPRMTIPQQNNSLIEYLFANTRTDLQPLPPPSVGFYNLESLLVEKTSALLENIKLLNGNITIGLRGPFPESVSALLPSTRQNSNDRSEHRSSHAQGSHSDPRQSQQDPRQNYNDQRQQFDPRYDQRQDPRASQLDPRAYQNDPRQVDSKGYQRNEQRMNQQDPRVYQNEQRGNQSDPRTYQNHDPRSHNDRDRNYERQSQQDYPKSRPVQDIRPERSHREQPLPPGPDCEPSYIDPSVSPDSIKILSRTVFLSGFPPSMQQQQLKELLESAARIQTIRVNSQKQNAFIKVATRKEAEALQYAFQGYPVEQSYLKVGWASGYGPREHFTFNTGTTLYPIRQIPPGDISFIENSARGGGKVVPSAVMEEPDLPLEVTLGSKRMEGSPPKRANEDGGAGGPPRQRW